MTKQQEIYHCNICGNTVEILFSGNGTLVCCGEPMKHLKEQLNENNYSEKHIPFFINGITDGNTTVQIGEILHPMSNEHHIKMIEIFTDKGFSRLYLDNEDKPIFSFKSNQKINFARSYCNLHGLWKGENNAK